VTTKEKDEPRNVLDHGDVFVHVASRDRRPDVVCKNREVRSSGQIWIEELRRYAVKSMQGEKVDELRIAANGVDGDRDFGVLDVESGTVISAKREGRLLEAYARVSDDGVRVRLPDGREIPSGEALDRELTTWLGREVRVVHALRHGVGTFECPEDFERDESRTVRWQGTGHSFVDESDLHLLTTADLALLQRHRPELQWDVRRFRPNIVLAAGEDATSDQWIGQQLRLGEAIVRVTGPCTRCVMTTRAQPDGLERQLDILHHVIQQCGNSVGVRATVVKTGRVFVGDDAQVL